MVFKVYMENLPLRRSFRNFATLVIALLIFLVLYQYRLNPVELKQRHGRRPADPFAGPFNSTCSSDADQRGPHQKIIAYSLYGNFSAPNFPNKYLRFFGETLNRVPLVYPGWVVRIYHNLSIHDAEGWKVLESAIEFGSHIDLCNATELIKKLNLADIFAMTWRWLPLIDGMVDTLMSRDSDSKIIVREQDAVREWLASNRTFHIMRDHPQHCAWIVGCCWGVKVNQNRSVIFDAAQKMFHEDHRHEYDYDQKLLSRLFWPIATTSMIAHDSYCCEKIPFGQPYPTKRKNGLFVGGVAVENNSLQVPCPLKCRPANATSEWNYC